VSRTFSLYVLILSMSPTGSCRPQFVAEHSPYPSVQMVFFLPLPRESSGIHRRSSARTWRGCAKMHVAYGN